MINVKLKLCISLSIFLQFFTTSKTYVVTTPRKWASDHSNQVCVTLRNPSTVNDSLSISISNADVDQVEEVTQVSYFLEPRKLRLVTGEHSICDNVHLDKTSETSGTLKIEGTLEGKPVEYLKTISIAGEVMKTFVQTDKYLYKPSQKVQFRILTIEGPYLKVIQEQYEEIWVENPSGSRINQWLNVSNPDGLIHQSFELSDEPEEGKYKIQVRSPNRELASTTFSVEEYVLPRFEVTVKPPPYVLGTTQNIVFEVCSKYTFGQPVKGNVTFNINNGGWGANIIKIVKNETISGCKNITITSDELGINHEKRYVSTLKAKAAVKEEGTGIELKSEEITVKIKRVALSFKIISVNKLIKPELPFLGELEVTFPDSSPAVDEPIDVCIADKCKTLSTNAKGILKFFVPPHLEHPEIVVESVNYKAIRRDGTYRSVMFESKKYLNAAKYFSPSNSSLIIALDTNQLDCSRSTDSIQFQLPVRFAAVNQTSALVSVQLVSRGQIQFSKIFQQEFVEGSPLHVDESLLIQPLLPPVTKGLVRGSFSVPISLQKTVSPEAKIIIWYTRDDGEVVADYRKIEIESCLPNNVNLTWSSQLSGPGDDVKLSLEAEPLSLCSLGVVDKSVQLLSTEKSMLTISSLLEMPEDLTISEYENRQVDDFKYCQKKMAKEEEPTPEEDISEPGLPFLMRPDPLFMPPRFYVTDNHDALHMFDGVGLYVLSDETVETRPCRGTPGIAMQEAKHVPRLAMPFSFSSNDRGENVRNYFPETWLWDIIPLGKEGFNEESLTLPDTVTEWVGSAVCVHPTKGVGVSNVASITTFRDFFADLTIPASVKRGEIFPVKISVFNYLKESLPIRVVLENSLEYEIIPDNSSGPDLGTRGSCIQPEDKKVFSIKIKPTAVGLVNITVSSFVDVNSVEDCGHSGKSVRSDVLIKPIRVEIEGFVKEKALSKYVCAEENSVDDTPNTWTLDPPEDVIPESVRGFVGVVGDMMGPTIDNLGHLVKMPYGCGEQNMIGFAPNIFVMHYLEASGEILEDVGERAIRFMEKGYQRELNYRHKDGSYSAFGERDDSGSTWLTAYVHKCFAQAAKYINIDNKDREISREWLKQKQLENGCFESVGKVLHKGMKGGVGKNENPAVLSSFVLISLLEADESPSSKTVREAIFCLKADNSTDNPYNLALKAYALALAKSPYAKETYASLLKLGKVTPSILHFEMPKNYESTKGIEVETAGYATLAALSLHSTTPNSEYLTDARKIVKWINNKRNGQGGFVSTQDTIVALQALAQYEIFTPNKDMELTAVIGTNGKETSFVVNQHNKLLQQNEEISSFPAQINFEVVGKGCALIQGLMRYNIPNPEASRAFNVSVAVDSEKEQGCKTKRITACTSYRLEDGNSNMGIIEVDLVSGYIPNKNDLKSLVGGKGKRFKRYEVDGSLVTFYADEFTSTEVCASFRILREVVVENAKPGSVKVYDYYKPEYFVTEKYAIPLEERCATQVEGSVLDNKIGKIIGQLIVN